MAKKVRVLDATNNKIAIIPDYVALMTFCNRLALSRNRLVAVNPAVGSLANLRVLLLDHNRLRDLPREMFHLPKLERLSLAHNSLAELPRGVRHLKALKYLDVASNKLVSLPREVGELGALEELHAADNALARIPVDVAKLERLRLIHAENNMIDGVPPEVLMYCENLQTVALHGNPVTLEALEATKGYADFEARRQKKWDKTVAAGVLLGPRRFEEAADRERGPGTPKAGAAPAPAAESSEAILLAGKQRRSDAKVKKRRVSGVKAHEVNVDAMTP